MLTDTQLALDSLEISRLRLTKGEEKKKENTIFYSSCKTPATGYSFLHLHC